MGCSAQIVHTWPDGTSVDLEVCSDGETHPDLLDEVTARVITLYRETCVRSGE